MDILRRAKELLSPSRWNIIIWEVDVRSSVTGKLMFQEHYLLWKSAKKACDYFNSDEYRGRLKHEAVKSSLGGIPLWVFFKKYDK